MEPVKIEEPKVEEPVKFKKVYIYSKETKAEYNKRHYQKNNFAH